MKRERRRKRGRMTDEKRKGARETRKEMKRYKERSER